MTEVLCLGLMVADVFPSPLDSLPAAGRLSLIDRYVLCVGGCAANTAADLARLGRKPGVVGMIGKDLFGDFVKRDLTQRGVDTAFVIESETQPTSCTFIINVRGEDRRFIHCAGANAVFSVGDMDRRALDGAKVLYAGGFLLMPALRPQPLAELFQEARHRGLFTVLDVVIPANANPSLADVAEVLAHTDAFLPNRDEAAVLTGRSDPFEQAEILARINPDCTVVVTLGGGGLVARRASQVFRADAYGVDSIDGSGAGDAFDAGFIVGMIEGWPLEDSLRFASAVGASCTQALGCHDGVFRLDEALTFVSRNHLEVTLIA